MSFIRLRNHLNKLKLKIVKNINYFIYRDENSIQYNYNISDNIV